MRITLGLDIGSTASKCIVLRGGAEIAGSARIASGIGSDGAAQAVAQALDEARAGAAALSRAAVTGYGRNTFIMAGNVATDRVSELTCHALGAAQVFPGARTVIDIGGQDSKAISVGEGGRMTGFLMNDKCAAGTGRFLEVMTKILSASYEEFDRLALSSAAPAEISNTCTVFAESEVISRLAAGASRADVAAGVCASIASRVSALAKRRGVVPEICMSGGVSMLRAVRDAVAAALGEDVLFSPLAQHFGALGAAVYAYQHEEN
jgi:predicted CoA-substrate-specific enzyme activase